MLSGSPSVPTPLWEFLLGSIFTNSPQKRNGTFIFLRKRTSPCPPHLSTCLCSDLVLIASCPLSPNFPSSKGTRSPLPLIDCRPVLITAVLGGFWAFPRCSSHTHTCVLSTEALHIWVLPLSDPWKWVQNSCPASWKEGIFFSFAGGTRLEIRSPSSGPNLSVALSDSVSYRLCSDLYSCFEDVAPQFPLAIQSRLKYYKDKITP